jgi:GldM C-terminal domain/Gram-negative bacterial TonB protein C-terminal
LKNKRIKYLGHDKPKIMKPGFLFNCLFVIISFACSAQTEAPVDSIAQMNDTSSGKRIFEKVEIEASFSGGEIGWRKFLEQKLNANVPVDNGAPSGRYTVIVQFVVDRQGNIRDVKALTKHGYGMEAEVMRIIRIGPKWVPAIQDGRSVNAYRKQPVTFVTQDDNFDITSKENYVLYTDIDNLVTIKANKVKDDDLQVTISQGTIVAKGNGQYIVKVNKPGRAVIELFNTKKGNKKIGAASFEVNTLAKTATTQ